MMTDIFEQIGGAIVVLVVCGAVAAMAAGPVLVIGSLIWRLFYGV